MYLLLTIWFKYRGPFSTMLFSLFKYSFMSISYEQQYNTS